jgi:ectoine hydroxylase-related dioxygenase (phytanoyl-CoA dioxygenase family)
VPNVAPLNVAGLDERAVVTDGTAHATTEMGTARDDLFAPMASHRDELDAQGYTIVENVLDPGFVDEVASVVRRLEDQHGQPRGGSRFRGLSSVKVQNLLAKDDVFRRLALNSVTRHLLGHVLGDGFLVTTVQSYDILPGEDHQPIHVDDMYYASVLGRPHPPLTCNTMWAISDFTDTNGATVVLPGSHRWGHIPGRDVEECTARADVRPAGLVDAVMPRGSVLVYHGSLWHGGGANRSDARRVGVCLNHCVGWVRPEHNNLLSMPTDVVRTFDRALQELLGFGVYKGKIGHLDGLPPLEALSRASR